MNRLFAFGFATLASYTIFLGCAEILDDLQIPNLDQCNGGHALSGTWQITGEGKRSSCRDEFLNTDRFSLGSVSLLLEHDETSGSLELADSNLPESFEFRSGSVDGICVNFRTTEVVGSQTIDYRWEGNARSDRFVEGTFKGTGPSGCISSGTFEMNKN